MLNYEQVREAAMDAYGHDEVMQHTSNIDELLDMLVEYTGCIDRFEAAYDLLARIIK